MKKKALSVILWISEENPAIRKTLLLKVLPDRGAYWQSVTGSVEEGESYLEGALREAEEESGLQGFRHPQYLGMQYEFTGRWGQARERAYVLIYPYGTTPPKIQIDPKEHTDYQWLEIPAALKTLRHENNRTALKRATETPSPLYLSSRGEFFHEGIQITHEKTVNLFHNSITWDNENYFVAVDKEKTKLYAESYPFFINSIDLDQSKITLLGGKELNFDPQNVFFTKSKTLFLRLANEKPASFLSHVYYDLANYITEEENAYKLNWHGRSHLIKTDDFQEE